MLKFYKNNGYNTKTFLIDREFECTRDSLYEESNLNTTSTNEHVTEIELKIRIIKEFARAMIRTFPFNKIPGQIIIKLIRFVGVYLDQEPSENGVSNVYYPPNIIMGQDLAYENHCKFRFRSYVESHEDCNITNVM